MDLLLITGRLVRLMLIKINLVGRLARPTDVCLYKSARELTQQGRGRFRDRGPLSQGPADGVTTADFKASDTKRSVRIYCGIDFLMSLSVSRRNEGLAGSPATNVRH